MRANNVVRAAVRQFLYDAAHRGAGCALVLRVRAVVDVHQYKLRAGLPGGRDVYQCLLLRVFIDEGSPSLHRQAVQVTVEPCRICQKPKLNAIDIHQRVTPIYCMGK